MTIGKLPATGPSPSPTQKTRKPPTTTGLASSKPNRPRTACRQSPSSPNPERPQNHLQRHRAEPALPTRRLPGPVAPPRPSGRSRTPHPPRSRLRDRRKAVRRQARPRLMRRRPVRRLRSASRPRRHRNPPTRPPAAQAARNFWNQQRRNPSASRRRRPNSQPHPLASPLRRRRSRQVVPRLDRRTKARPSPTRVRATTRAGSRTDSVSERPGGLELEQGGAPVQRVCFDHYRTAHQIAVPGNNRALPQWREPDSRRPAGIAEAPDRTAESELRIRPAAARRAHRPARSCARWRSSAMRCRRKHCWPRRDGIRDCCRYRHGAPRRTMRTPSHWHNPPPSRPSILHRTA